MQHWKQLVFLFLGMCIMAVAAAAGEEWYVSNGPTMYALRDVSLAQRHAGVIVGDTATILTTTNGGLTWNRPDVANGELLTNVNLRAVIAHPLGAVVAVGEEGRIVRSGDGRNFTALTTNAAYTLNDVAWNSDTSLIAVGVADGEPLILRLGARGATWTRVTAPDAGYTLGAVRFISSTVGVAVGMTTDGAGVGSTVVLRTTDDGATWTRVHTQEGIAALALVMRGLELYAFGLADDPSKSGYLSSRDMGATWTFESMPELGFISSAIVANGTDIYALGHRFVEEGENVHVFATQFIMRGVDRNWAISDIADGWQGALAASATGDRAVAVGDSGRIWVRWYSHDASDKSVIFGAKHIEFGATLDQRDSTIVSLVQNNGNAARTVRSITVHDPRNEWQLLESYNNVVLEVGATLDVELRFAPSSTGDHWAFLRIAMENGTEHIVHLSGERAHSNANSPITLLQPLYNFGDVNNPFGVIQNIGEIIRNDGNEAVTVTNVEFEGEDLGAFVLVDAILPFTLEPGGLFNCEIRLQPKARGLYRTTLKITVADTQIRIPIVGSSRIAGYNDVIDVGTVKVDSVHKRRVWFSSKEWDEFFDAFVFDEPGSPWVVTESDVSEEWDYYVDVEARPQTAGVYVAPAFGSWGYGGEGTQWIERKILRMNAADAPTSVHDDVLASGFTIAPQPAREMMTVRHAGINGATTINLMDVQGRHIYSTSVTADSAGLDVTIPMVDLHSGVYLLIVNTNTQRHVLPVVKR